MEHSLFDVKTLFLLQQKVLEKLPNLDPSDKKEAVIQQIIEAVQRQIGSAPKKDSLTKHFNRKVTVENNPLTTTSEKQSTGDLLCRFLGYESLVAFQTDKKTEIELMPIDAKRSYKIGKYPVSNTASSTNTLFFVIYYYSQQEDIQSGVLMLNQETRTAELLLSFSGAIMQSLGFPENKHEVRYTGSYELSYHRILMAHCRMEGASKEVGFVSQAFFDFEAKGFRYMLGTYIGNSASNLGSIAGLSLIQRVESLEEAYQIIAKPEPLIADLLRGRQMTVENRSYDTLDEVLKTRDSQKWPKNGELFSHTHMNGNSSMPIHKMSVPIVGGEKTLQIKTWLLLREDIKSEFAKKLGLENIQWNRDFLLRFEEELKNKTGKEAKERTLREYLADEIEDNTRLLNQSGSSTGDILCEYLGIEGGLSQYAFRKKSEIEQVEVKTISAYTLAETKPSNASRKEPSNTPYQLTGMVYLVAYYYNIFGIVHPGVVILDPEREQLEFILPFPKEYGKDRQFRYIGNYEITQQGLLIAHTQLQADIQDIYFICHVYLDTSHRYMLGTYIGNSFHNSGSIAGLTLFEKVGSVEEGFERIQNVDPRIDTLLKEQRLSMENRAFYSLEELINYWKNMPGGIKL